VLAPLAPGLLQPVGVTRVGELLPNRPRAVNLDRGTVAVDGERELEFGPDDRVTVTLRHDGPRVIDVAATLGAPNATHALLTR
ncbi:MAG TPA: ATP-NAD kinase, partial [Nakamurella sp.]